MSRCFRVGTEPFVESIDCSTGSIGVIRTTPAAVTECDAGFARFIVERRTSSPLLPKRVRFRLKRFELTMVYLVRGDGSEFGFGGAVRTHQDCGLSQPTLSAANIMLAPGDVSLRWRVWVMQGPWPVGTGKPDREPDAVFQQELWRVPAQ